MIYLKEVEGKGITTHHKKPFNSFYFMELLLVPIVLLGIPYFLIFHSF